MYSVIGKKEREPNLRMQCIVGSLYTVYATAIFGIVERVQNYAH